MVSITNSFGALKKLKVVYHSHLDLELVQLLITLFNLDMKGDDSMALAFEIIAFKHDIDAIVETFVKVLYPTKSHYIESLQASD